MLKKAETLTLVFSFHTTADAMHAESIFKAHGLPGRIIPVPRSMSAGCGLAWGMPPEQRETAEALLREEEVYPEQAEELMLRF